MSTRLSHAHDFPEGAQAMVHLERAIRECGLEPTLLELVKTRASQLNGCAFCVDMHTRDARAAGETEQRLYALSAWREGPFFTPRERSALAWTEALTNIQDGHVPDQVYEEARQQFTEKELVRLTFAVTQVNAWDRIAIGFRMEPGEYQPCSPNPAQV